MCASCGCGKKKGEVGYGKGAKSAGKNQDAKVMKGMTPKQKVAFEKADKNADKALAKEVTKKK